MNAPQDDLFATKPTREDRLSVSGQIVQSFIDALAETPAFQDIAARLQTTIFVTKKTSEAALRQALFGPDDE